MIPGSVAALVSFLLLLAPGILWQLIQARHTPAVKETAFVEISRVVLASLAATGGAGLLLLLWPWLPLYRRIQAAGDDAFSAPADALPYLGAVVATSLVACALAWGAAKLRWRRAAPRIRPGRIWSRLLVDYRPPGSGDPSLLVELLDGTVWRGTLEGFDSDPEDDQRNLALGPPLARKKHGAEAFERKGDAGRYVILPEGQIKSIQVIYVPQGRTGGAEEGAGAARKEGQTSPSGTSSTTGSLTHPRTTRHVCKLAAVAIVCLAGARVWRRAAWRTPHLRHQQPR